MSISALTDSPDATLVVTHGRVVLTKLLAAVCGVAYCFAIAAAASTGEGLKMPAPEGRSSSIDPQNLVFAVVCFGIGVAAMVTAIRIRHRMGRPIFEPWQHW